MQQLIAGLIQDVFCPSDELVGKKQGDFNLMFASDMSAYVRKYFGENFSKIEEMDAPSVQKACKSLFSKADAYVRVKNMEHQTSTFKQKLSAFSSWLSEFDINSYRKKNLILEIPGQYEGNKQPLPEFHNKISYFLPEILVIQSIRKPKRLSMFGSDEKVYHMLVKGGEDLRLD